jgi:abhydrolase domain-containing protein 1/3
LPTGDFLSILATFFRSHPHPYRREQVKADDGAMLNLDWLEPETADENTPVLIVLPGITGHSKSGYLVHLVNGAYSHGWRVVVLVYPGTDLSKVSTARFIRGHVTHDLEITIDHIKSRLPAAAIYGAGYSMGAALLTKYLAHHGSASKLNAGISCSNPFDVLYSVQSIAKGYIKQLYNIHFLGALKKMYRNNLTVFQEAFPHMTPEDVAAISSVEEYDTKLTMAHFGFSNLQEYYVSLGCKDSVSDVSVPMLVAHARDDPIVPADALPMELLKENKNIITMITDMGGHTGWLQGLNPMGPSWFDDVALEWMFNVHEYILKNPAPLNKKSKGKVSQPATAGITAIINAKEDFEGIVVPNQQPRVKITERKSRKEENGVRPQMNGHSNAKSPKGKRNRI